jgi:hypothetical protein
MFDNTDYHDSLMSAVGKKFYDSEGQEIIGTCLESIAHSLASIADALDEINEKLEDKE